jgi:hypothetical protein
MFPTINLNGTNPDELKDLIEEAIIAIWRAYEALEKTAPHGRDYPNKTLPRVFGVDITGKHIFFAEPELADARHAVQVDLMALHSIQDRLQSVWSNIDDQMVLRGHKNHDQN